MKAFWKAILLFWELCDIAANGPRDARYGMRLRFGIAEAVGIITAVNSLFGGGDGGAGDLQMEIGRAMLDQFRKDQAIRQPMQRDLAGIIRARQGKKLPLNRVNLATRANPFMATKGEDGTFGPSPRVTSRPVMAPNVNGGDNIRNIGSFLRNKAVLPTLRA